MSFTSLCFLGADYIPLTDVLLSFLKLLGKVVKNLKF